MGRALWEGPGGNRTFPRGGGQCFPSLSQEPPRKGQKCPRLLAPGVGGGFGTAAAQVKTQWHGPRKACTAHTILLPLRPGQIIHPYKSKQHLRQGSDSPPLCTGNMSLTRLLSCQRRLRQKLLPTPDAGTLACASAQLCYPRGHVPLHCITQMGCGQQTQWLCT